MEKGESPMQKKAYFFKMELWNVEENVEKDYKNVRHILQEIVDKHAIQDKKEYTLNVTEGVDLHTMVDVVKLTDEYCYCRAAQQKPTGSFTERNYMTNISKELLDGKAENEVGIEIHSYFLISFVTGIVEAIIAQGAPKEKVLSNIFEVYASDYSVEMIPIPNPSGAQSIYGKEGLVISKLAFETVRPDPTILNGILGIQGSELLAQSIEDNIKIQVSLVADSRGEKLIEDSTIANGMIRSIEVMKRAGNYTKALFRGKYEDKKTRDYSFFDENFSYPVDIPLYRIRGSEKQYYRAEELKDIYYQHMFAAYHDVKGIIVPLANRTKKEDE